MNWWSLLPALIRFKENCLWWNYLIIFHSWSQIDWTWQFVVFAFGRIIATMDEIRIWWVWTFDNDVLLGNESKRRMDRAKRNWSLLCKIFEKRSNTTDGIPDPDVQSCIVSTIQDGIYEADTGNEHRTGRKKFHLQVPVSFVKLSLFLVSSFVFFSIVAKQRNADQRKGTRIFPLCGGFRIGWNTQTESYSVLSE